MRPSPLSSLPRPSLTKDFQQDFQALLVSHVDSHFVGATVAFLDVLQQERSIEWMENGSSCVGCMNGWAVRTPVVLQDGAGAGAIEVLPLCGVDVCDVTRPRKQH